MELGDAICKIGGMSPARKIAASDSVNEIATVRIYSLFTTHYPILTGIRASILLKAKTRMPVTVM